MSSHPSSTSLALHFHVQGWWQGFNKNQGPLASSPYSLVVLTPCLPAPACPGGGGGEVCVFLLSSPPTHQALADRAPKEWKIRVGMHTEGEGSESQERRRNGVRGHPLQVV